MSGPVQPEPSGRRSSPFRRDVDERLARWHPATFIAAAWAMLALRVSRRRLRRLPLEEVSVAGPPGVPWGAYRGVLAVLRRQPFTCLERSLVLQRWLSAYDRRHDVVVGVARDGADFKAHAWLDFEADVVEAVRYTELLRIPPR